MRGVAECALLGRGHRRVVMGDLRAVAVGATRDALVATPDQARGEIVMTLLALDVEGGVAIVGRHLCGEVVVAEGALPIHLIGRRRGTAVLCGTVTAGGRERNEQSESEWAIAHGGLP